MQSDPLPAWVEDDAHFSSPRHRVWLRRRLSMFGCPVVFVLHNPSTAGLGVEDPTSRRGIAFANMLGASDLIFVNAVTGIATNADDLAAMDDPVGPLADEALLAAARFCETRQGIMIASWGCPKGRAKTRSLMTDRFRHILGLGLPLHALRITASGHPEHLLYLPSSLRPVPWDYAAQAA
ncbi:DUF1643 domain-containing protein [Bosea sp. RAC05]|uniref:DUF1643 domain-containing protein n=1 Tax=Bosea sp. RAC05 TaxID=1842539 RepID=UPI00083DFE0F|nr:DUF1643 domain-containing protein [Bosea sp. RAC05]AOG02874.1 hypothetical protein BSY19_4896 [Bosea sp. RAC05]